MVLVVIACIASLTSLKKLGVGASWKLPDRLYDLFEGVSLGLDLQGGLRLTYEVEVEAAVEDQRDRMADDIIRALAEKAELKTVTFTRGVESAQFNLIFASQADRESDDVADILKDYRGATVIESADGAVAHIRLVDKEVDERRDVAVKQAVETIENRINELGLVNTTVVAKGNDVVVEIPGVDERRISRIKRIISTTARLEFKIVDETGSKFFEDNKDKIKDDGPIKLQRERVRAGDEGEVWSYFLEAKNQPKGKTGFKILKEFISTLKVPADRSIGYEEQQTLDAAGNPTADVTWRTYYMQRAAGITGEYVDSASVRNDEQRGNPYVSLTFSKSGAGIFGDLTGKNVGRRMAIQLDEKVQSAPNIQEKIGGGSCQITLGYGDYNALFKEAQDLVVVLRAGALPAPIVPTNESTVGPALGGDSIKMGNLSFIVGFILVVVFMAVYYKGGGIAANLALFVNAIFTFAIMGGLGATLTLPGIAGMILTLGMAVDANVLICERIREELLAGKSPRAAVDAGYARAFWTILDSHVTTIISGIVLLQYGTGDIKGFAVTLLIGVTTSFFTAIYVSRIIMDWMTRNRAAHLSI
jgi:preprotein translocase subunit SecD